jgi:hypothetical protein
MATVFVKHKVADYTAWRKVYDEFDGTRQAKGVTAQAVYQSADDPNDITVTHDFGSITAARAFVDSKELHDTMRRAGVVGAPTIWFANRA